MNWIAPSEINADNAALKKRFWDVADQSRANSGLKSQEYSAPVLGLIFLRFANLRFSSQGACIVGLSLTFFLFLCGCSTNAPQVMYMKQDLGVVTGVQPLVAQPDLVKWRQLKVGMTEAAVTALLGQPYQKDPRPAPDTDPKMIHVYVWRYGEISFKSFTTQGSFEFVVKFHEGLVEEISDPWNGKFSTDGIPTVPELMLPKAGQTLDHYPRFMDFRWQPSSGVYPIEYEVLIQVMEVDQHDAEHFEDYIRETVDHNRADQKQAGKSQKEMDETAAWFARDLRQKQGVMETYSFRTHDIYLPYTWVGANTGRWRVRAVNEKGTSDWTAWRYFKFST